MIRKNNWKIIISSAVMLSLACLFSAAKASAATSTSSKGITISPAFQQITVKSDETDHPIQFSITNNEASDQTVKLSSADFNSLNETGGLFFVGASASSIQKNYGLVKWLSLPQTQYAIPAGKTVAISASLQNLNTMPGGGHYGALLVSIGNQSTGTASSVAIHPIASSLFFVTKAGGDFYDMHLQSFTTDANLWRTASKATIHFKNTGNTHLIPRGVVSVTQGNTVLSRAVINDSSSIVLPGVIRRFTVDLKPISKLHPGLILTSYKVRIDYRYDGNPYFATHDYDYHQLNIAHIVTGAVIIVAMLLILRAYRNLNSWKEPDTEPKLPFKQSATKRPAKTKTPVKKPTSKKSKTAK